MRVLWTKTQPCLMHVLPLPMLTLARMLCARLGGATDACEGTTSVRTATQNTTAGLVVEDTMSPSMSVRRILLKQGPRPARSLLIRVYQCSVCWCTSTRPAPDSKDEAVQSCVCRQVSHSSGCYGQWEPADIYNHPLMREAQLTNTRDRVPAIEDLWNHTDPDHFM